MEVGRTRVGSTPHAAMSPNTLRIYERKTMLNACVCMCVYVWVCMRVHMCACVCACVCVCVCGAW